jgi:hypothetical protein
MSELLERWHVEEIFAFAQDWALGWRMVCQHEEEASSDSIVEKFQSREMEILSI